MICFDLKRKWIEYLCNIVSYLMFSISFLIFFTHILNFLIYLMKILRNTSLTVTLIFPVYRFEFYGVVLISKLMCLVLFFVQLLNSNSHQIMPHKHTHAHCDSGWKRGVAQRGKERASGLVGFTKIQDPRPKTQDPMPAGPANIIWNIYAWLLRLNDFWIALPLAARFYTHVFVSVSVFYVGS